MQNIKDMNSSLTAFTASTALPYKVGDVVWCTYTEPASERKVEKIEISSESPSGVRVLLAEVRTATETELWLDSGWVEPIRKDINAV